MKSTHKSSRKSRNSNLRIAIGTLVLVAAIFALASAIPHSKAPESPLSAASLSLVSPTSGSFQVGQIQSVDWTSHDYSAPTVSIALIRKVGNDPARYELVRTVATATQNDGSATWVPNYSDIGNGLSLEVGCTPSANACTAADSAPALAVVDTGAAANTASAYEAIEDMNNK